MGSMDSLFVRPRARPPARIPLFLILPEMKRIFPSLPPYSLRAVLDFLSHTVTTNMDSLSTSFDTIYFPAITVCNMNFMQRSVLEKYDLQVGKPIQNTFSDIVHIIIPETKKSAV